MTADTAERDERGAEILAYTYCPMKKKFWEGVRPLIREESRKQKRDIKYYIPMGCSTTDPYDSLWLSERAEDLPRVIASVGLGDFFQESFRQRFVDGEEFERIERPPLAEPFRSAGYEDPLGRYCIYSLFPKLIMTDQTRLEGRPAPRRWEDLLNPIYKNDITIGYSHNEFNDELLLYMYKEHGKEGLAQLAQNIRYGWHGSRMARKAGKKSSEGSAVYVISWFFAVSSPWKENTRLIWPDDGSIATPCYLLARRGARENFGFFIDYLTGPEYGRVSAGNRFPSLNGQVDNLLPRDARFKWLGWDYIRSHSIGEEREMALRYFKEQLEKREGREVLVS